MIGRYTRPEMGRIWSEIHKFERWIEIEVYACEAWADLNVIPREVAEAVARKAKFPVDQDFVNRVSEIEREVKHDVIAFTTALAEKIGEEGRFIHYGLTSYDVVDTALSSLMVEALNLIIEQLKQLIEAVKLRAIQYKDTPMIGRTHGVHAEPITFGFKLALWYSELNRHLERLERAKTTVGVGKLSGAVGTYANIHPYVEQYVCKKLGLVPAPISSQVLQRDRHAEYVTALGLLASALDKFSTEIRSLQRTEIREVEEPFKEGQKGSSAMPHKRNPVMCERISGLARVVRGHVVSALENMLLWHERDISNSAVERIVLPDVSILLDFMLASFTEVVANMKVYPEQMLRNLELTQGLIYSQRVLLLLVAKGMSRELAYKLVQEAALKAWEHGLDFRDLIANNPQVRAAVNLEELESCFDYKESLRHIDQVFQRLGLC